MYLYSLGCKGGARSEEKSCGVSVKRTAHLHSVLVSAGRYGVSFLPESLEREAQRFAGLPLDRHEPEPRFAWRDGIPVLEWAAVWFTADVADRHATGDHTLFVGQVRDFLAVDAQAPPLVFHRSQFARLVAEPERGPLPTDSWGGVLDLWG